VFVAAHRATKSHAYVQCIRTLDAHAASYRVLALSATPGSDLNQVNEVVQNLHISRIEVRTHDDTSVAKYRKETTVRKLMVLTCVLAEQLF
jgi:ATP-dependent DNA helicase MPH1